MGTSEAWGEGNDCDARRPHRAAADGEIRRLALVLILLLGCNAFLRALPREARLYGALGRAIRGDQAAEEEAVMERLRAKDPPLGSRLPVPGGWARGAGYSRPGGPWGGGPPRATLVIMIGGCSNCALSTLRSADELLLRHPALRVVAVTPGTDSEIKRFRAANRLHVQMVSDAGGRLALRYNAAWTPRSYLITARGSLVWCQRGRTGGGRWVVDPRALQAAISGG